VWGKKKNQREKNAKIHILQGSKTTLGETAKLVANIKLSSAMT
jgi:hypothetical protein